MGIISNEELCLPYLSLPFLFPSCPCDKNKCKMNALIERTGLFVVPQSNYDGDDDDGSKKDVDWSPCACACAACPCTLSLGRALLSLVLSCFFFISFVPAWCLMPYSLRPACTFTPCSPLACLFLKWKRKRVDNAHTRSHLFFFLFPPVRFVWFVRSRSFTFLYLISSRLSMPPTMPACHHGKNKCTCLEWKKIKKKRQRMSQATLNRNSCPPLSLFIKSRKGVKWKGSGTWAPERNHYHHHHHELKGNGKERENMFIHFMSIMRRGLEPPCVVK